MSDPSPAFGSLDLTICDREPIHIPGSIQPHGVLFSVDPDTLKVVQVAGDTKRLLGVPSGQLLGKSLEAQVAPLSIEHLRALIAQDATGTWAPFKFEALNRQNGERLDASVHVSDGMLIVELELRPSRRAPNPFGLVKEIILQVQRAPDLSAFLQTAAEQVRAVTRFDRVMIYQFQADESGAVIAEAKSDELEPYLGLHYPASDIPKQARELYRRSWIRLIPDVNYTPAPLKPEFNPVTGRSLDLSFSQLRSVSHVHLEYLRNMGVAASMSLSIIVEGKLWGLIACHHRNPRNVTLAVREVCELFAQMMSLQLREKLALEAQAERLRMRLVHAGLVAAMVRETDPGNALIRHHPNLLDYIPASGAIVWWGGNATRIGETLPDEQLAPLIEWLDASMPEGVYSTDCLGAEFPPAKDYTHIASGLLALSVSRLQRDYVIWFMPEKVRQVTWAGDPSKAVEPSDDGLRLVPRKSFAAWKENVHGKSTPWIAQAKEAAHALRISILEVFLHRLDELIEHERTDAANKAKSLFLAQMSHELRTPLNAILGFAALIRDKASGAGSGPYVEYADDIARSGEHLLQLINEILDLAHVEAGRLELHENEVNVSDVITHALRLVSTLEEAAGIRVKRTGPKAPVWMFADETRLKQILINLLTNAIKFTPVGGQVILNVRSSSKSGLFIDVKDTGIGMSETEVKQALEMFGRIKTPKMQRQGTGIGLPLAVKLTELHGGKLSIKSTPGQGTTASLHFPSARLISFKPREAS
jgi:light-regulated signal transduction histidine kinase (bacteriophytochrome)